MELRFFLILHKEPKVESVLKGPEALSQRVKKEEEPDLLILLHINCLSLICVS